MQRNEQLRRQRIGRNWRQQDLADQLGVTVTTIQRWERGSQHPSAYYRVKLCALFGLSSQELGLAEGFPAPESITAAAAQAVSAPSKETPLWTVPYARNPHFTGRDDLLQQLEQLFAGEQLGQRVGIRQAALTQTQAMTGLGGIGKTQIAIEYAYRARLQGRYRDVMWIAAATEEAILTSFVELARLLPALVGQEETNPRPIVAAVVRWLEEREQPWLLIFDNADDLDLVQPFLPRRGNGHILLTTRAHAVGAFASSLEVESMGVMEGTHLLLRRAHRFSADSPEEMDEAINIVIALAQFPLAIDQAGAYIEETGCSLHEYLSLYQEHRSVLLARRGRQTTGYPGSVATTWSLSFERVEEKSPAAAEFLCLCAFLAPDHIPEELLTEGAPHWPEALQQAVVDRLRFNQMLSTLLAFSLIKRLSEDRLLSIHRLVQVVQMERMPPQEQRQWAERFVHALDAVFPENPKDDLASWPQCQRYLEQGQAGDMPIEAYHLLFPEAAQVLSRIGIYLSERGMYALAEPVFQRALDIWEQQPAEAYPQVIGPLNDLALLYYRQEKFIEAERFSQRALHLVEEHGEQEHLHAAEVLNVLATTYIRRSRKAEAEPLLKRVLSIREQRLGELHPLVASALSNLAILHINRGEFREAQALLKRSVVIREQHLGETHPEVAISLNILAVVHNVLGRYAEAEALAKRSVVIREQHLGETHPEVAISLTNLADSSLYQGRYAEAEALYQRALDIKKQVFGEMHSSAIPSLYGLAKLYFKQGRDAEAEALYQRAQRINEQGQERAEPLYGLAKLYFKQGKDAEAEALYRKASHIQEQEGTAERPEDLYPLRGLADLYSKQGKDVEAEALYQRVLAIGEQHLGPEHPDVATALCGLARLYAKQGKDAEAEALYQRVLRISEQHLGLEHIETAAVLHELAGFRQAQGQAREAAQLYQRALAIRENVLGADLPPTIDTREQLIALLQSMGCTEEAAQLGRLQPRATDLLSDGTPASSIREAMERSAAVAGTGGSILPACPQCQQTRGVLKSGKNRSGSQRFRCRTCRLYFTPQPSIRQPDQARKAEALALAEQGMSYRRIARQLGVHHQTVGAWISTHGAPGAE